MSIVNFYDKTVDTKRLATVSGTKKEVWGNNLSDVSCTIRPMDGSQSLAGAEGAYYKQFKMYCPSDSDILIGDQIIDGSDVYVVKGVKAYTFASSSSNEHLALALMKTN